MDQMCARDRRAPVTRIAVPASLRGRSTLPRVDYADAFRVDTAAHPDRTAPDWAREILEGAPASTRARLVAGWSALGLRSTLVRSTKPTGAVLGWEVRRSTAEQVLLGRESRVGMPGELLFALGPHGLVFATFVHHRTPLTRPMWAGVENAHVRTVLELLERAADGPAR